MKEFRLPKVLLCIVCFCFCMVKLAAGEVNISGKVVDENGKPISGAEVKMKSLGLSDITNSVGVFELAGTLTDIQETHTASVGTSDFNGNSLSFSCLNQKVSIIIYDLMGRHLITIQEAYLSGTYQYYLRDYLPENDKSVYFLQVRIGTNINVYKFINQSSDFYGTGLTGTSLGGYSISNKLKNTALNDKLVFSHTSFKSKEVSISCSNCNIGTVKLQSLITSIPAPSNLNGDLLMSNTGKYKAKLSWTDNSDNEEGFEIERSVNSASFTKVGTVANNVTNYTGDLNFGTTYKFRVRALNSAGYSPYSNTKTIITPKEETIPLAPSNLNGDLLMSNTGNYKTKLSWTDNSDNEEGFEIERSVNNASFAKVGTVANNVTNYTGDLNFGTTYKFRVRALNNAGYSPYSNTKTIITPKKETIPLAPSNLVLDARSPTRIRLTWKDNSDDETGFEIQRKSPTLAGVWEQVTVTNENRTSFNHTGLNHTWPGYRIRAKNAAGSSSWSLVAYAPRKLRIINDLFSSQTPIVDWKKLNNIVRVRIGKTQASVENTKADEKLSPVESVINISQANWISPKHNSETSYEDFPIDTYNGLLTRYYVYIQCGWWEYVVFDLSSWWELRVSNVLCTNGTCCCYKWASFYADHYHGYLVVKASQFLPDGHYNNTKSAKRTTGISQK